MEFKGTKGKWELVGNEIHCNNLLVGYATNSFFINSTNDVEAKANALLMSKAPEILEILELILEERGLNKIVHSNLIYNAKKRIKEATNINK